MSHIARVTVLVVVSIGWGQTPSAPEAAAMRRINAASSPDEQMAAVDSFVKDFPDSAVKGLELTTAAEAADKKGDSGRAIWYGELAVQADPGNFTAMLLVAGELAQHTSKGDPGKEEKLAKAESYVAQALPIIPTAVPPPAWVGVTYERWQALKKDQTAMAHKVLGMVAEKRGEWRPAAEEYQMAIDAGRTADPVTMARLCNAENELGKYADALAMAKRVLALDNWLVSSTVREFAEQQKTRAEKGQAGKGGAAPAPQGQSTPSSVTAASPGGPLPAATPATLSLGMTTADVVAILGQPDRVADVGAKQIYIYRNLKVTFVSGQVTDVN